MSDDAFSSGKSSASGSDSDSESNPENLKDAAAESGAGSDADEPGKPLFAYCCLHQAACPHRHVLPAPSA